MENTRISTASGLNTRISMRCGLKKICCCCCCCCCFVCMYAVCSTVVMRKVSIDDTGARCAVRTWGVLCGVRVARSPAPEPRVLCTTATSLKQTQHRGALLLLLLLLLLRVYVCSVLYGSHAEGVIRRHRGALCSAYVGRAVRVRVARSPAPEPKPRVL